MKFIFFIIVIILDFEALHWKEEAEPHIEPEFPKVQTVYERKFKD